MITVTRSAAIEMRKRGRHILFSCRSGGCNGFEYCLEAVDAKPCPSITDAQQIGDVTLYVCHVSTLHILGTTIKWKDDIMGSRFEFDNPNAQSMCGCGSTFSV